MRRDSRLRAQSRPRDDRFLPKGHGSQPNEKRPPCRPPVDFLPSYLYRTMCHNGSDLIFIPNDRAMQLDIDDYEMRECVVECVVEGSRFRSPFLHFSRNISGAMKFYDMATPKDGSERDSRNVIIRIDVKAMIARETLTHYNCLDISSEALWRRYIEGNLSKWGSYLENNIAHAISMSVRSSEVLICFRGQFSFEDAEIIDPYTFDAICPYNAESLGIYGSQPKLRKRAASSCGRAPSRGRSEAAGSAASQRFRAPSRRSSESAGSARPRGTSSSAVPPWKKDRIAPATSQPTRTYVPKTDLQSTNISSAVSSVIISDFCLISLRFL